MLHPRGPVAAKIAPTTHVHPSTRCCFVGISLGRLTGCDSITCICGRSFSWTQLVSDRFRGLANAFRDAFPENTRRLAAEITRRGPPGEQVIPLSSFHSSFSLPGGRPLGPLPPPPLENETFLSLMSLRYKPFARVGGSWLKKLTGGRKPLTPAAKQGVHAVDRRRATLR